jgi:hypothetical protein
MLRRVTLVRTEDSEELSASFIRVTRIGELGTTLAVTSNRRKLRRNNLKSYNIYLVFSLFTSSTTSLFESNVLKFVFLVQFLCYLPVDLHQQTPEADVSHVVLPAPS